MTFFIVSPTNLTNYLSYLKYTIDIIFLLLHKNMMVGRKHHMVGVEDLTKSSWLIMSEIWMPCIAFFLVKKNSKGLKSFDNK